MITYKQYQDLQDFNALKQATLAFLLLSAAIALIALACWLASHCPVDIHAPDIVNSILS